MVVKTISWLVICLVSSKAIVHIRHSNEHMSERISQPYNTVLATLTLESAVESTEKQGRHLSLLQKEILNEVPSLILLKFIFLQSRSVDVAISKHGVPLLARVHPTSPWRWLVNPQPIFRSVTFHLCVNALSTARVWATDHKS